VVATSHFGGNIWIPATRKKYSRNATRYLSELADIEWSMFEPLLPGPSGRGRPRYWPLREIVNAIFYVT
jgi:putative transposase